MNVKRVLAVGIPGRTVPLIIAAAAAMVLFQAALAGTACAQYRQNNLVADVSGQAPNIDPSLIDPWGLVLYRGQLTTAVNGKDETPGAGGGGIASFYDHSGSATRPAINVPAAPIFGDIPGSPTGIVVNTSDEFVISKDGKSAPAELLFDSLDGTISGWSPKVDPNNAIIVIDNSTESPIPASYTGLTIARGADGRSVLYAVDSGISPTESNNEVVMYDGEFNEIGSFGTAQAPANMTAFNIRQIQNELFVTYAAFAFIQGGSVAVFDRQGNFLRQFAANGPEGPMEEPWGLALAPKSFGPLGGAVLVGDVSDGIINAFDPGTGQFVGRIESSPGNPIALPGLWGLLFHGGELYFSSGPSIPPNSGPFGVFEDGIVGEISAVRPSN